MNRNTRRMADFFSKENIKYYIENEDADDAEDILTIPVSTSKIPGIIIKLFVSRAGKASYFVKLGKIDIDKQTYETYPILNELNRRFSFVSFSIGDNGAVCMDLQYMMNSRMAYNILFEYFNCAVKISEEAYESLIPILWDCTMLKKPVMDDESMYFEDSDEDEDFYEEGFEEESGPFLSEEESLSIDGDDMLSQDDILDLFAEDFGSEEDSSSDDDLEEEEDSEFNELFLEDESDESGASDDENSSAGAA